MPVGFENTTDPKKATANQRALIQSRGDDLIAQQQQRAAQFGNNADQTSSWIDSYLQGDVEGNGGYNPEEAARIANSGDLEQYGLTPEGAASNFLTPEEQAQIKGNPNYHANFNPDGMSQTQDISAGRQRQAASDLKSGLKGAINPDALRQSSGSRQDSENQLNANQGQFGTVLGAEGENVRGAIDPSAVNPSSEFLSDYSLTPEEQQDIVTGAGISAGAGYRASEGSIDRAARAAGASPMGVAAYRARAERDAAAAGGDAMTQARIKASEAAAGRQLTSEQLRENAGRYLTDTKTGTELKMGEQALAGTQHLGDQALGQRNTLEQQRLGAEQYLTGANLNAATTGGEADLANEANINAQGRQQQQFNATTGATIAQNEDNANSTRAGNIATNRQNTNVNNQNTVYNQGAAQTGLASQQAKTVADKRLGARDNAVANYTGQQQQSNQNQQNEENRQVQTYGTQAGATNQATGQMVEADKKPALWEKIAGTVIGAARAASGFKLPGKADGGISTQPEMAMVGEEGPEWLGPMDGSGPGVVVDKPTYAMLGADEPEQVVPLGYRAKARTRPSMAFGQQQAPKPRRMYGEAAA